MLWSRSYCQYQIIPFHKSIVWSANSLLHSTRTRTRWDTGMQETTYNCHDVPHQWKRVNIQFNMLSNRPHLQQHFIIGLSICFQTLTTAHFEIFKYREWRRVEEMAEMRLWMLIRLENMCVVYYSSSIECFDVLIHMLEDHDSALPRFHILNGGTEENDW